MPRLLRIFSLGIFISFLGSLPLGTLNIAAMQIAISDGVYQAILFSLGSLTAEVVYVRLSLIAMDWVTRQKRLFRFLEWLTVVIVLALAFSSFYAALHPRVHENIILSSTLNRFLLGLIMSAVNPVQIPFWFGWSTVLFSKRLLIPQPRYYNFYIIGIGLGTLLGNFVFIFGGRFIGNRISDNQHILSFIIGSIFAITAAVQLYRIFTKKDVQHQIEHPEELTDKFGHTLEVLEEKVEQMEEKLHQPKKNSND